MRGSFHAVEFAIHAAKLLEVEPVVKYAALSLFSGRFAASLERIIAGGTTKRHWLLHPVSDSNLQLFALISIWISSKMYMSKPLSAKALKSLGDAVITEQHFTSKDYFEAEVVFLQAMDFEIGCASSAFAMLQELYVQFKEVAKVGDLIDFRACTDILDLLYEKEEMSRLYLSPVALAASILVCSYIITVPKQAWEFPILLWVA
ncbi:hypothetical protein MLD38_025127 [Melastoma candidum]|uniref:Uncharacterized protein n=1 Tax=Melastoma candidum TaxID=119954 RepID=A0ACB9NUC9_9MYRT|nr:hypothetical protein MLD38_025127 [Melastoma candidum]